MLSPCHFAPVRGMHPRPPDWGAWHQLGRVTGLGVRITYRGSCFTGVLTQRSEGGLLMGVSKSVNTQTEFS